MAISITVAVTDQEMIEASFVLVVSVTMGNLGVIRASYCRENRNSGEFSTLDENYT